MLGRTNSLLFPRLVHIKEVKDHKGKLVNLYRLDWSGMENILLEKYESSGRTIDEQLLKKWEKPLGAALCPPKDPSFYPALPSHLRQLLDDTVFNIKPNYRNEIIRNAKKAVEERNIERSFDTSIRDMCQQTVESHVEVAFRLLADCIYNVDEMNFSRDYVIKFMLPKWMLFRFWFHQTGWGVAWERAKFRDLNSNLVDKEWCTRVGEDAVENYTRYSLEMLAHMDNYKKHIGWPDCNADVIGPSLGEKKSLPIDGVLYDLLAEFTELYRENSHVVSLDVFHVNSKMPFETTKEVTDIARVFSRRSNLVPDMVVEGEKITIPNMYSLRSKQDQDNLKNFCKTIENFINKENRPYILKVLVDEKDLKIGAALIEF